VTDFLYKCARCKRVQSVNRTADPTNKLVPPYNPEEPCGFCGLPMTRLFTPPVVQGETCVKEQNTYKEPTS
jgi:hypothetical protein